MCDGMCAWGLGGMDVWGYGMCEEFKGVVRILLECIILFTYCLFCL